MRKAWNSRWCLSFLQARRVRLNKVGMDELIAFHVCRRGGQTSARLVWINFCSPPCLQVRRPKLTKVGMD